MTKTTRPARDVFKELLSPEQLAEADQMGQAIVEEYRTLQDLRKALGLTQTEIAKRLGIAQNNVSRLENQDDLLLSTLEGVIHSMGGELELRINFPGRPPAILSTGNSGEELTVDHEKHV